MKKRLIILLLGALSLGPIPSTRAADASSRHWQAALKEAAEARTRRDYAKARSIYEAEADEADALGSEVSAENSALLGSTLLDAGLYNDANGILARAVEKLGPNPVGQQQQFWRGVLMAIQADVANYSGRPDDALGLATRARAVIELVMGSNHPELFRLDGLLGSIYASKKNFAEAEKAYLRALKQAEIRRTVAGTRWTGAEEQFGFYRKKDSAEGILRTTAALGDLKLDEGKYQESEEYFKKSLKIAEGEYGKKHQAVVIPLEGLARLHLKTNRPKEFEADVQRMYELSIKAPGLEEWVLNPLWLKFEADLIAAGNSQASAEKIAQVVSVQNFNPKHMATRSMAIAGEDWARIDRAQNAIRAAALAKYSGDQTKLAPMFLEFIRVDEEAGKNELARANYEALIKTQEKSPEKSLLLGSLGKVADSLIAENKPAEALAICQKITATLKEKYGDDSRVSDAMDREAMLLKKLGRENESAAMQSKAAEVRKKAVLK